MPKNTSTHSFIGRIPELNYVLLRNHETKKLELWTESKGVTLHSIVVKGVELEFIREAQNACRVLDNEFNRIHCPDDIGRIFVDVTRSLRATVLELS